LSGALADFGTAIKNGIELYRSENPNKNEFISFIYEDDQYDAKSSISAYRKLLTVDKVDLFFSFGSPACSALGPIVDRERKLLICFTSDEASALNTKNVIRAHDHSAAYIRALLGGLRKKGEKVFAIVNTEMGYTNSMLKAFQGNIKSDEHLDIIANVNPSEIDFRSIILKAKGLKVKTLGLFLLPNQLLIFMKQARELKFTFTLFSTNLIESALLLPHSNVLEGAIYAYYQMEQSFIDRYDVKYKLDAQMPMAGNAYDLTDVVTSGFNPKDGKDLDVLRKIFTRVKGKAGNSGLYSYIEDKEGGKYFSHPMFAKEVRGGRGIRID